jgi:hypothetical protein
MLIPKIKEIRYLIIIIIIQKTTPLDLIHQITITIIQTVQTILEGHHIVVEVAPGHLEVPDLPQVEDETKIT